MVFESTSMRYETLVARFWLRVRGVPQSSCRRQSRDKRQELWSREWHAIRRDEGRDLRDREDKGVFSTFSVKQFKKVVKWKSIFKG